MKPLTDEEVEAFKEKLEAGGDPNGDPVKWGDWRPIFWAATSGNFEILFTLLNDIRINVNVTDNMGCSALHHAVMSACRKGDRQGRHHQCIDLLMRNRQMKLNMLDKKGYTAIGRAVDYLDKARVEQMLKHPSADRLYLDYYAADRESTMREIIRSKYPELQPLLPPPLRENLASPDRSTKLLAALQHDRYIDFRDHLDLTNPNPWYDEPYHSTLLEIACQMKNREQFVRLLLRCGSDPNIKHRVTGMPLLHATARSGNLDLLEILLKQENIDVSLTDRDDRTILHWLARISGSESGDKERLERCFELLLGPESRLKVDIDDRDGSGNTALHIAVECEFLDRVLLLLRSGADITKTKHDSSILSSISTSFLEDILDECLETNNEPVTSRNLRLIFRYEFLANMLPHMAECSHLRGLLRHPVISSFLSLKWRQVRLIFFVDVAFYVAFVLFLTAYILLSESDNTLSNGSIANSTNDPLIFSDSYVDSGLNYDTRYRNSVKYEIGDSSPQYLFYPLMILLSLLTVREMFQLITYGKMYILSLENWLELLLISATLISCSGAVHSLELKLHSSAVAILLGWLDLVLLLGRLPLLSVQLEMLRAVTWTFLRFMAGYVLLLMAFALSFYILFKGSLELDGGNMFENPFLSVLKTIVMFTGELEASNLTFKTLPYTSHVIFLLFVFLVAIVLLNLLNGLAVNDTETIRKIAETLSLVARVRLITKLEAVLQTLSRFVTPSEKMTDKIFVLYPNRRPNSIEPTAVRSALRLISKKRQPIKKRTSDHDQADRSVLMAELSALRLRHEELEKTFESKFEETRQILVQILTCLENRELNVNLSNI
jgi:ankyrin repeat protein